MSEYRVNLDIYNGPLDLLLYLIRRDELDIYDIPITRITEQYIQYVDLLKTLDPNLAGEFLVTAATLMEIKTRMLLPAPSPEEGGEQGVEIDPRAELVRQLMEYKAFKDAADDLRQARDRRSAMYPRGRTPDLPDGEEIDLEDAQVWDLLEAFSNLMAAIGANRGEHEVIYDDTPVELHEADILDRLAREGPMTFSRVFEGRTAIIELVGLFLALLELIRRRRLLASQDANFAEIRIRLNPDPPPAAGPEEDRPAGQSQTQPPAQEDGAYVSEYPSGGDDQQKDANGDDGGADNPTVGA